MTRYKLAPEPEEYCPRGQGTGGGWIRIGRYDHAGRRALWVRFIGLDDTSLETRCDAIELCAGREGDDAFVRYERNSVGFDDLLDCMLRAADHIPERYPAEPVQSAAKDEG